ncbi:hypothetical protein JCM11251_004930 [Rhodosporidiobolus azoricus]
MSRSFPPTQPRSPLSIALHLFAFTSLCWSFKWLYQPGPMTEFMDKSYGGRWQFLTILSASIDLSSSLPVNLIPSLAVSLLVFLFSLLYDLVPLPLFAQCKTSLAVLAVPVEGLVGLLYWGLTLYDPTLLNPNGAEFQLPFWVDVSIHGLPAVYLWLDFLLFSPPFPKRIRPNLLATTATAAYCVWMEVCAKRNGWYPYPMLNTMSPLPRLLFYLCQIPLLISLYKLANGVHRLVRGETHEAVQAKGVRKVEGGKVN